MITDPCEPDLRPVFGWRVDNALRKRAFKPLGIPDRVDRIAYVNRIAIVKELGSKKLLQITAPISPGSSGGPVLNEKGEVIGVSVATFREGQT